MSRFSSHLSYLVLFLLPCAHFTSLFGRISMTDWVRTERSLKHLSASVWGICQSYLLFIFPRCSCQLLFPLSRLRFPSAKFPFIGITTFPSKTFYPTSHSQKKKTITSLSRFFLLKVSRAILIIWYKLCIRIYMRYIWKRNQLARIALAPGFPFISAYDSTSSNGTFGWPNGIVISWG